jgi:hypothetical protein
MALQLTNCCDNASRGRDDGGSIVDCDNFSMASDQPKERGDAPGSGFPFEPVALPSAPASTGDLHAPGARALSTAGVEDAGSTGQHRVDRKAFKGRGTWPRLAEAKAAVDSIHDDMRRLAAATRSIKTKRFYLALHTRSATGQLSLRWRRAGTADTRHLAWDALDELLAPLPAELVQWYRNVNSVAIALNGDEKHARAVRRHVASVTQQRKNHPG